MTRTATHKSARYFHKPHYISSHTYTYSTGTYFSSLMNINIHFLAVYTTIRHTATELLPCQQTNFGDIKKLNSILRQKLQE